MGRNLTDYTERITAQLPHVSSPTESKGEAHNALVEFSLPPMLKVALAPGGNRNVGDKLNYHRR